MEAVEAAIELLNSKVNTPPGSADDFYYVGVQALLFNERNIARDYFEKTEELGYDECEKVEQHLENLKY